MAKVRIAYTAKKQQEEKAKLERDLRELYQIMKAMPEKDRRLLIGIAKGLTGA